MISYHCTYFFFNFNTFARLKAVKNKINQKVKFFGLCFGCLLSIWTYSLSGNLLGIKKKMPLQKVLGSIVIAMAHYHNTMHLKYEIPTSWHGKKEWVAAYLL